jgi:hypothetical protein
MKKALWWSWQSPTEEQLEAIRKAGFELEPSLYAISGTTRKITNFEEAGEVIQALKLASMQKIDGVAFEAVFGVFPTPVQSELTGIAEFAAVGDCPETVKCYGFWDGGFAYLGRI